METQMKNILSVFSNKNSDKTFSLVISNGNYDIIKKHLKFHRQFHQQFDTLVLSMELSMEFLSAN
jgi:hypothetical protein